MADDTTDRLRTMKTDPAITPKATSGDNLKATEERLATDALGHLDKAREIVRGIAEKGGPAEQVMGKTGDAIEQMRKAEQGLNEIYRIRRPQALKNAAKL